MAEHEHQYHEVTGEPLACPDGICWWNDPERDWVTALEIPSRPTQAEIAAASGGPEFPEHFTGAGPMFAALPLGTPWLDAASRGATTYVLESPYAAGPEMSDEQANAAYGKYTGWSTFLDRDLAVALADAPGRHGEFTRFTGLTGWNDWTAKNEREYRAGLEAGS